MRDRQSTSGSEPLWQDALLGAIAGAVGVWVLDRVDWYMFEREDPKARERTEAVRPGGMDPAHVLANRAANAMGLQLRPGQPHPAGIAVHYAIGVTPAALYGMAVSRNPTLGGGYGTLYGLSVFLVHDEVLNPALGLAAAPQRYPWQAHARGFVAHLVYGAVTHAVFHMLKGAIAAGSEDDQHYLSPQRPYGDRMYPSPH